MECRHCASALERPGDYCLVCRSANADTAVLDCGRERATVSCLLEETVVAERTITTEPEEEGRWATTELRNYAGRVADEVRRKRPEEVYAAGDREVLSSVRADLHYPFYRVRDDDPIEAVRERRGEPALEVVEASVAEKLGGSHSTLIGGRDGRTVLETVADHPHVKKIVPGPIDAGGSGSRTGVRAKATRADGTGNVRLLIRDGSSVQENRVVTTAGDRKLGEHVRADLNDALAEAGLRE
ncbi:metal-binding protein [Halobacteriales archaeon QS_4_69_225]|nr:MAG: metal-binding protein [Halobacteriales archaeon QS_4_69_225]